MFYVHCKYVADNPSFKTGAGAWKVTSCYPVTPDGGALSYAVYKPIGVVGARAPTQGYRELMIASPTPRRKGDFCNPRKILNEILALRRWDVVPV